MATRLKFGPFDFTSDSGELRKHGVRIRLAGKPQQLLTALLESPGEVVMRDELRLRLWPGDPSVDVEAGLNTAAKRLRDALNDSAEEPRYVETVHRTGYRFIASVQHVATPPTIPAEKTPTPPGRHWPVPVLTACLVASLAMIGWLLFRPSPAPARFHQITFQRGSTSSARFGPDGETILYSMRKEGDVRVYAASLFGPETRELPGAVGTLLSVSNSGEMALSRSSGLTPLGGSTLWRMPINGGGAVEMERNVFSADWSPLRPDLIALSRAVKGECRLEFPPGEVRFKTSGYINNIRFAPGGGQIAFIHHPVRHDEAGDVMMADLGGKVSNLSKGWTSLMGLAWNSDGKEVWFGAAKPGSLRGVFAVRIKSGVVREIAQAPGNLGVNDISRGRVLVSRGSSRLEMAMGGADAPGARDISWLDWSSVKDMSDDGSLVLFEENGYGVGGKSVTFVRRAADGSTLRIGDGIAMALSASASAALVLNEQDRTRLRLVPIGRGTPRDIQRSGLTYQWAKFFPGEDRLLALASRGSEPLRLWIVDVASGKASPISPPGMVRNAAVSPDGRRVAALTAEGRLTIYPVSGEPGREVATSESLAPLIWTGAGLLVQHTVNYTQVPARVSWIDPETGRLGTFADLAPPDAFGVNAITRVIIGRDARHWAFSYRRVTSDLFLTDGWK